jgi:enoyl-CoA hydratase/carnithine racemase
MNDASPSVTSERSYTSGVPVTYDTSHGVATIALNRPEVLNALDSDLAATLAACVERAAADASIQLVVVRGRGRAFCSGMDRTALARGTVGEPFYRHWIRALNMLEDMPKVSIAVLHGYSIGGGLQLATSGSPPTMPSSVSAPRGTGSCPTAPFCVSPASSGSDGRRR